MRNGPCIHSGTGGGSPVVTLLTAMCTTGLTRHILNRSSEVSIVQESHDIMINLATPNLR
jgi:hypothetical protein